jgi:hypothetical protein
MGLVANVGALSGEIDHGVDDPLLRRRDDTMPKRLTGVNERRVARAATLPA